MVTKAVVKAAAMLAVVTVFLIAVASVGPPTSYPSADLSKLPVPTDDALIYRSYAGSSLGPTTATLAAVTEPKKKEEEEEEEEEEEVTFPTQPPKEEEVATPTPPTLAVTEPPTPAATEPPTPAVTEAPTPAATQPPPVSYLRVKFPDRLLPRGILAGIRKCGSTTLFELLGQHPQVIKGTKELNYFGFHALDERGYVESFPLCSGSNCTDKLSVDGTVACTSMHSTPFEIFDTFPDMKLMFLFRNPTLRAYSAFRMDMRNQPQALVTQNFTEYALDGLVVMKRLLAQYESKLAKGGADETFLHFAQSTLDWFTYKHIGHGLYYHIMKPFFKLFSRENILIMKSKQLDQDPETIARRAFRFLGIQDVSIDFKKRANEAPGGKQSTRLDPELVRVLEEFYAPHNLRFNELVQEDMELGLED